MQSFSRTKPKHRPNLLPIIQFHKPRANPHGCIYGTGCTDYATMCDPCWTRLESGKSPSPLPVSPCLEFNTMCDYCWRAYEWVGVSRSVVGKNDPCLDVITMCDGCRKTFNALRNTIPASYLLPKPGTYPVKIFRRFKPEDGATQQTIHDITEHIMKNVSARFAEHVTIHAFAITPVGGRAPAAVWVLIDLPCFVEVDVELLSVLFDALPGGSERWIVKTPMGEQCIAFFRMCWWRTKMEFHAYDTLPVLTWCCDGCHPPLTLFEGWPI